MIWPFNRKPRVPERLWNSLAICPSQFTRAIASPKPDSPIYSDYFELYAMGYLKTCVARNDTVGFVRTLIGDREAKRIQRALRKRNA